MYGVAEEISKVFFLCGLACGVIGWVVIEGIIWLVGFLWDHITWV